MPQSETVRPAETKRAAKRRRKQSAQSHIVNAQDQIIAKANSVVLCFLGNTKNKSTLVIFCSNKSFIPLVSFYGQTSSSESHDANLQSHSDVCPNLKIIIHLYNKLSLYLSKVKEHLFCFVFSCLILFLLHQNQEVKLCHYVNV